MTMQEIMETKQQLLRVFGTRVEQGLRKTEVYDFSLFLEEPMVTFASIIGQNINIKHTVFEDKNRKYTYGVNQKSTLRDWCAVVMLNVLRSMYKVTIPQGLLRSFKSFEMLSFMFFALWDNMIINTVVTTRRASSLKCHTVRMLTVSEVQENRIEFEQCLATQCILMKNLTAKTKNKELMKVNFDSLSIPVLVMPETNDEETSIEVMTEYSMVGTGVEAEVSTYAPQGYLDLLVEYLTAFMQQVPLVCRFTHIKSDLSTRLMYTSLNPKVLGKVWENDNRVNLALSNSKPFTSRGYIQIPDLELPENDVSQTRALNLLRIVDFRIQKKDIAKIKKKSAIAYKDARFALRLLIMNMCPNGQLTDIIYKALRKADIISDGVDIYSYDNPDIQYQRVMEIFDSPDSTSASFDAKCYVALQKLSDNPEKVLEELQPIKIQSLVDVTESFAMADNQLNWLIERATEGVLRIEYRNRGGFTETKHITKSKQIVAEVYGIEWKTMGKNYTLAEQKQDISASIDVVRTVHSASIIGGIATEWGIEIDGNDIETVRSYVINKLTEQLKDIEQRLEKSKSKKRTWDGTLLMAYSLDVNKALIHIDPKSFNLFRSFSIANIEKVELVQLGDK